jgi:hypothetical protein
MGAEDKSGTDDRSLLLKQVSGFLFNPRCIRLGTFIMLCLPFESILLLSTKS